MTKELSRRVRQHGEDSCGPCCGAAPFMATAEMVVEDEGKQIYLLAQWMPEMGYEINFVATTESLYDAIEKFDDFWDNGEDDENGTTRKALDDEVVRIYDEMTIQKQNLFGKVDIYERYAAQYQELVGMLQKVADDNEYDMDLFAGDDEDEDEEEDEE